MIFGILSVFEVRSVIRRARLRLMRFLSSLHRGMDCGGARRAGRGGDGIKLCVYRPVFVLGLVVLLLSSLLAGCAHSARSVLIVSAAANLQPALEALQPELEQAAGMPVTFSFGATGKLAQQLEQGAPVDVFLAANTAYVAELAGLGVLQPDSVTVFASGELALRPRAGVAIAQLADLLRPDIRRIALANPQHAPYGMAARQALQAAGLWQSLQPRLVFGENAIQSYQYVQTGNADVAILPLSLAHDSGETATWIPIDRDLYSPLLQTAAVVNDTRYPDAAARFVQALTASRAQALLHRYGYSPPPTDLP